MERALLRLGASECEQQPSLVKRFVKAEKYFTALSSAHKEIVGAEVLLYLGNVLVPCDECGLDLMMTSLC